MYSKNCKNAEGVLPLRESEVCAISWKSFLFTPQPSFNYWHWLQLPVLASFTVPVASSTLLSLLRRSSPCIIPFPHFSIKTASIPVQCSPHVPYIQPLFWQAVSASWGSFLQPQRCKPLDQTLDQANHPDVHRLTPSSQWALLQKSPTSRRIDTTPVCSLSQDHFIPVGPV